ncbi:MAG: hypothetical protein EOP07_09435 [Proteobacteria bacterium]|nr:MAG: hypothetical protein EOP07_09435 [Pseudomonadota bacterium]
MKQSLGISGALSRTGLVLIVSMSLASCKTIRQRAEVPDPNSMEVIATPSSVVVAEPQPAESEGVGEVEENIPAPVLPKDYFIPDGTYLLKNVMSGKCFEFPEAGKFSDPPRQFACRGTSPQYFRIKRLGANNRYMLQNAFSEKYLQIKGRSMDNGGQAEQAFVGSDIVQEFAFDRKAEGQYALRSLFSGKVLDVADNDPEEGIEIHQWDYVGQTNQVWQLLLIGTVQPVP